MSRIANDVAKVELPGDWTQVADKDYIDKLENNLRGDITAEADRATQKEGELEGKFNNYTPTLDIPGIKVDQAKKADVADTLNAGATMGGKEVATVDGTVENSKFAKTMAYTTLKETNWDNLEEGSYVLNWTTVYTSLPKELSGYKAVFGSLDVIKRKAEFIPGIGAFDSKMQVLNIETKSTYSAGTQESVEEVYFRVENRGNDWSDWQQVTTTDQLSDGSVTKVAINATNASGDLLSINKTRNTTFSGSKKNFVKITFNKPRERTDNINFEIGHYHGTKIKVWACLDAPYVLAYKFYYSRSDIAQDLRYVLNEKTIDIIYEQDTYAEGVINPFFVKGAVSSSVTTQEKYNSAIPVTYVNTPAQASYQNFNYGIEGETK